MKKIILVLVFCLLFPVFVSAQQTDIVMLEWDANTEGDLAGYKVYVGTTSEAYTNSIDVADVTDYTIQNLTVGTTYYFVATAYDTSGNESGYSNEVSYLVVDATPPSDVVNLKIIIITQ